MPVNQQNLLYLLIFVGNFLVGIPHPTQFYHRQYRLIYQCQ